jgi:hypothetical protein
MARELNALRNLRTDSRSSLATPKLFGIAKRVPAMPYRNPKELADRMAARRGAAKADDGYTRETFTLPRDQARQAARAFLTKYPKVAYMTEVEAWRKLPGGAIEFTMRRLKSAD